MKLMLCHQVAGSLSDTALKKAVGKPTVKRLGGIKRNATNSKLVGSVRGCFAPPFGVGPRIIYQFNIKRVYHGTMRADQLVASLQVLPEAQFSFGFEPLQSCNSRNA